MIFVERTNPREPQVADLLRSSHALMQALFPPEHNNYLSLDELSAKNVHLFAAHYGSVLCGTGALAVNGRIWGNKVYVCRPRLPRTRGS